MTFTLSFWGDTESTLAFKRDNARTSYAQVGYDEDGLFPIAYFLNVEISPINHTHEFAFCLIKIENNDSSAIFDSKESNKIIHSTYYRSEIRKLLFRMAEDLVRACNLDSFFMETYCENLPEKALSKYKELCLIFEKCGYEVDDRGKINGKNFWIMNRTPSKPTS